MADLPIPQAKPAHGASVPLLTRLALSPRFHALAERIPLLRRYARAEGAALFDLVQGFVQSQALYALAELSVMERLAEKGWQSLDALAHACAVPPDRMAVLLQAGAAMKLLTRKRDHWHLAPRGAAFVTVPGLSLMVRHHHVLYGDLSDPVAFFRDGSDTGLARFWPYVFGADGAGDPALAARYSRLMAESQGLVAADTLRLVDLSGVQHLMDVGGGTGAFLASVGAAYPALRMTLFDLPAVVDGATLRLAPFGARAQVVAGSFRDDPLPRGAEAISLVRVLYDHADSTVDALLGNVFNALPSGGRIVISEPMSGGDRPDPATDVYFAVYTLAMQTGRLRSAADISARLNRAGFVSITDHGASRPYVTRTISARKA